MYTGRSTTKERVYAYGERDNAAVADEARRNARQVLFNRAEPINEQPTVEREPVQETYRPVNFGPMTTEAEHYYTPFNRDSIPTFEPRKTGGDFKFFSGTELKPRARVGKSELKPSAETLAYRERKSEGGESKRSSSSSALSTRTKVVIAVYAAVVILLIAMIVTSGVTAANLRQDIDGLRSDVVAARSVQSELQKELAILDNEDVLRARAEEIGMVSAEGAPVEVVQAIPPAPPVEYTPPTNWFDKLCGWLSGIFN